MKRNIPERMLDHDGNQLECTAQTKEEFEELRAWLKKLPSERTGPPPYTKPIEKKATS